MKRVPRIGSLRPWPDAWAAWWRGWNGASAISRRWAARPRVARWIAWRTLKRR